jgi:type I restriction enzyme S subunit
MLNQRVAVIRGIEKATVNSFIYSFLCSNKVMEYLQQKANTLMQPNLSIKDLTTLNIKIPSVYEQQAIVNKLDELSAETKRLEGIYQKKLEDLEELKKSILQKAFNGELTD